MCYQIGIDIGGTKIEGLILLGGNVVSVERIPTNAFEGYYKILERVSNFYFLLANRIGYAKHTLGIGMPGSIQADCGTLKNCNIKELQGKLVKNDIEHLLGFEPGFENDANCFAIAESLLGSGQGERIIFGAVLGTGCGAGIVVDGKILKGMSNLTGEWGHMSINQRGEACYCGRSGCVERYISGAGVEEMYFKLYNHRKSMSAIVECYRLGIEEDSLIFSNFIESVVFSLANVISLLDPDVVVLGGGLAEIDELFCNLSARVSEEIRRPAESINIKRSSLGVHSGSIGAALIGNAATSILID